MGVPGCRLVTTQIAPHLNVDVDPQRLQAWLTADPRSDLSEITSEEVLETLAAAQIELTDAVRTRVEPFVEQCRTTGRLPEKFLVAQGTPPTEGQHGDFRPHNESDAAESANLDEDCIDYRSLNAVPTVEKGQTIGTLIPAVPPEPGCDVCGKPIAPQSGVEEVTLGENVSRAPHDPNCVIATEAGTIVYRLGKLSVDEVVQIKGDVDYGSGNIDATSHVYICGTVHDLFSVRASKSITVAGAIEGAIVDAGEDLIVLGGIAGRGRARITAGATVVARFCNEPDLQAACDIMLVKECVHSRVRTQGKLVADQSDVIGGSVYARQGAVVRTLGNDSEIATMLAVGADPDVLRKVRRIDDLIDQLTEVSDRIRTKVRPLMSDLNRLTPQQRKQATELVNKARLMELEVENKQNERRALLGSAGPDTDPHVVVNTAIFPRVTIALSNHQTQFTHVLKGPIRIERRKEGNFTELVAVNLLTGSLTPLPTTPAGKSPTG